MAPQTITREERLTRIENSLFHNPDGLRVVELAEDCAVDRRTIYRDLAHLRASGVPVYRQDGRFYISRDYYLASVRFSIHEIIALFAAVRVMAQVAHQQSPHMVSALTRLGRALPATIAPHFEQTGQYLRETPVDRLFVSVLETLTRAWGEQRRVHIWYGRHLLNFAPYFLEAKADGTWYIVGETDTTHQIQALHLRRITRAELLTTHFQRPTDLDPTSYLSGTLDTPQDDDKPTIQVTLAVETEIAQQIIQDRKSVDLNADPLPDGREIISFTLSNWHDFLPWFRSLGPTIEILEPPALRDHLRQEAEQLLARYS